MKFTEFYLVDPIMSIIVSVFVLVNASKMLFDATSLFLEKTPRNIKIDEIKSHICKIEGIVDVHHIHIWSIDGQNNYAPMHIVTKTGQMVSKKQIRDELKYIKISHATIELEDECEICSEKTCQIEPVNHHVHHHHH
jgi:cobalt-zinc-cadmium efflux system protein